MFGFNIFTYLSTGTNLLTNLFGPAISNITNVLGNTTKNIISTTSTGTQKIIKTGSDTTNNIVDMTATGANTGIGFLQNKLEKTNSVVNPENNNMLIDNTKQKTKKSKSPSKAEPEPVRTQSFKQGYCFVGKINDTRYCAKANEYTECMSGDIYPSMDICINPNLRV